jgi:ornithine cyclodeaminase
MNDIVLIDHKFIIENSHFVSLIDALQSAFSQNSIQVPLRHHHDFENPVSDKDSTLLLMPAWDPHHAAGVKLVTVSPDNSKFNLPSIQGTYIYLQPKTGTILAIIDAPELTVKRTAASSALASQYLSRENASKLLMIGTGALAPNLIKAHAAVRPITEVLIWGRNIEKASVLCNELESESFLCRPVTSIDDHIGEVDIISCATLSAEPLVKGKLLTLGQHVDLVGSYKPNMREGDDMLIERADVFVDTYQGGLKETGDIVIPIQNGILTREAIGGDLFELCSNQKPGRTNSNTITCFKSVGHALEDLVAASYYYEKYMQ